MRQLTFKGFLQQYIKELSLANTLSLSRLNQMAKDNPRIVEPVALYVVLYLRKQDRTALTASCFDKLLSGVNNSAQLLRQLETNSAPIEFQRVYQAFLVKRNKHVRDNKTKLLMCEQIQKLQKKKSFSTYRLYTDLGMNHGNVNAFLKHSDVSKVSLNAARTMLHYAECL